MRYVLGMPVRRHEAAVPGTAPNGAARWLLRSATNTRCGIRELNATLLKQAGECNTTKSEQKALQ